MSSEVEEAARRRTAIAEYRKKLLNHKELESRVRTGHRNKTLILILADLGISFSEKKKSFFVNLEFFILKKLSRFLDHELGFKFVIEFCFWVLCGNSKG